MKVVDLEVIPVSVPEATAYETSLSLASDQQTNTYDHVVVRIEGENGAVGWGEVAPTPFWPRGLTQQSCASLIEEQLKPIVVGSDLFRIPRTIETMERRISDMPFPICAVDIALYDLLGKTVDRPVYDLLGGPKNADRSIDLHYSIGIKSPEEMKEDAANALESGYNAFKIKVGGDDPDSEREAIAAVTDVVEDAKIRVDANQGWMPDEAIRTIRMLDEAANGLVLVEQPVAYDDLNGLRRVKEAVNPPILADEACFSPRDVAAIARQDAADIVNIKLAKTGGLYNGRQVATVAKAHGLTCFMGGMVELGIGLAANAHFTLASPEITYPTGALNIHAASSLLEDDAQWSATDGEFSVPDKPGLGIEIDHNALSKYRTDEK